MATRRTVLITGVLGGIGQAVAAAFRSSGWYVIGVDLRSGAADVDDFHQADITERNAAPDLRRRLDGLGGLDALINNAAVQINKSLLDTTDADWERAIDVNVRGAFQMIREFSEPLSVRRGGIVNVGSVHSLATSPNVAAYAISKGAINALTRTAALELGPLGVRCNAVLPGAVATPMLLDGLSRRPHPDGPDGNLRDLAARTPLGFVATPEQLAPSILHLADSEQSPYTTGAQLVVDGGATLRLGTE